MGDSPSGFAEEVGALKIRIRVEALADIDEAASFYGQKDEDGRLAARFMREVAETIAKVS